MKRSGQGLTRGRSCDYRLHGSDPPLYIIIVLEVMYYYEQSLIPVGVSGPKDVTVFKDVSVVWLTGTGDLQPEWNQDGYPTQGAAVQDQPLW